MFCNVTIGAHTEGLEAAVRLCSLLSRSAHTRVTRTVLAALFFVFGVGIKASGNGLAFCKKLGGVDVQRSGDAFEKIQGGRKLCVLDLAHMAAAHVGSMSKLLLTEAAGASQVLDIQCYTVPQVHAVETDAMRKYRHAIYITFRDVEKKSWSGARSPEWDACGYAGHRMIRLANIKGRSIVHSEKGGTGTTGTASRSSTGRW